MSIAPVEPSLSPSMDIQVSSNFERLLFELLGRDAAATAEIMRRFRSEGRMPVPDAAWREARRLFHGFALDDPGTLAEIRRLYQEAGYLADPHTAVGTAAARAARPEDEAVPVVVAATAHPAKFPEAVGTRHRPAAGAAAAAGRSVRARGTLHRAAPDLAMVQAAVRAHIRRNQTITPP